MPNELLVALSRLSDPDLVARLKSLTASERETTAQLVAHLAELDTRDIHLREGYPSLFVYCRDVLGLSEHEAYNRIDAARAARRFPVILDLLAEGAVHLTTVRLLAPHLTPDNYLGVLQSARGKRKGEVEEIVARLAPRPDVAPAVRKLPKPASPPRVVPGGEPARRRPAPDPVFACSATACSDPPVAGSIQDPIHHRHGHSREAAAGQGPVAPRDPLRRRRRHPRPGAHRPPGRACEEEVRRDRPSAPVAGDGPGITSHPCGCEARGMEARPRTVRLHGNERPQMRRAGVSGVPSRRAVCGGRRADGRERAAAVSASQRVRGEGLLRAATSLHGDGFVPASNSFWNG